MRAIILLLASSAAYAAPGDWVPPISGIEYPRTVPGPTCTPPGNKIKRCMFRDGTEVLCLRDVCFVVDAREV